MSVNFEFYNDRDLLSSLPEDIRDIEFLKKRLTNKGRISFCGLLNTSDKTIIFSPRQTDVKSLPPEEKIKVASELMNAIKIYSVTSSQIISSADDGDNLFNTAQLSLVIELLHDYYSNGIYSRRQSYESLNSGKPNWKRTIARSTLYPNSKKQPIYLDIWSQKNRYLSECETAKIHAEVIQELIARYSWLITGKQPVIHSDLKNISRPNGDSKRKIIELNKELITIFSEREIRLIKNLKKYIKLIAGENDSKIAIGLPLFQTMWEKMIDSVLSNTIKINSKLPIPAYVDTVGNTTIVASKGQKTDTVLKHPSDDIYAVVDAKYYDATSINNAPGWPDLVKQFYYAKSVKLINEHATIKNAFIFPGCEGPLKTAHVYDRSTEDFLDGEFTPISCYYIDPMLIINHYVKSKKLVSKSFEILSAEISVAT